MRPSSPKSGVAGEWRRGRGRKRIGAAHLLLYVLLSRFLLGSNIISSLFLLKNAHHNIMDKPNRTARRRLDGSGVKNERVVDEMKRINESGTHLSLLLLLGCLTLLLLLVVQFRLVDAHTHMHHD
jgi:hypothetical protein